MTVISVMCKHPTPRRYFPQQEEDSENSTKTDVDNNLAAEAWQLAGDELGWSMCFTSFRGLTITSPPNCS